MAEGRAFVHRGGCHCGAIGLTLRTPRPPERQVIGACQCGFCRSHNARTYSDPGAACTLEAREPDQLQLYAFGLNTSRVVLCRRCGTYVAMLLREGERAWTTVSVDALDERALFTRAPEPRDFGAEDAAGRLGRRKARWIPTDLVGWPEGV
jgi:hypothetical protein